MDSIGKKVTNSSLFPGTNPLANGTEPSIYQPNVIIELIKAVGRTKRPGRKSVIRTNDLILLLEEAAAEFLHNQCWQSAPGNSGVEADLNAVSSAAWRFLVAMETASPMRAAHMRAALGSELRKTCEENNEDARTLRSVLPLIGYHVDYLQPSLIIDDCVDLITVIQKLADLAIVKRRKIIEANKKVKRAGKQQSARNTGDKAGLTLIADLAKIYQSFWGKAGVSRHPQTGEMYGPFIRFVEEAIRPLGLEMSGEAIAAGLRRSKLIGKSPLFKK